MIGSCRLLAAGRYVLRRLARHAVLILAATGLTAPVGAQTAPTLAQRLIAAQNAADTASACTAAQPFYWEIGNEKGKLGGGNAPGGDSSYSRDSKMLIASASKWWFAAYVAELHGGVLSASDLSALRMLSGYRSLSAASCAPANASKRAALTVAQCFNTGLNSRYTKRDDGYFYYDGGHYQKYAALDLGLGSSNAAQLGARLSSWLGGTLGIGFDSPQPAGGGYASAADYAGFLQKILNRQLKISALLGTQAVCAWTNGKDCPAVYSPMNLAHWHYSIGHWVEDDPVTDGSFSSPGLYGFYPWINASKTLYGIVARENHRLSAYSDSVQCGIAIRNAYLNP